VVATTPRRLRKEKRMTNKNITEQSKTGPIISRCPVLIFYVPEAYLMHFHIVVDFLIVPYKCLYGWGGGGDYYAKLLKQKVCSGSGSESFYHPSFIKQI
jgi:hypothetical protein